MPARYPGRVDLHDSLATGQFVDENLKELYERSPVVSAESFKTGSTTTETAITEAIAWAANLNLKTLLVPDTMLPYDASLVTFNNTVRMVREGGDWSTHDVQAYGAAGDGVANDTAEIQAAVTNGGTNSVIYFPQPNSEYLLTGLITVSANDVTFRGDRDTQLHWTTFGTATQGTAGIEISADRFRVDGLTFQGPSVGIFANEIAILMIGTSTTVRRSGLTVKNCEFFDVGSDGIRCQFVDQIRVYDNHFHNLGFRSAGFLSCNHGWFYNNRIETITPGTASNMYGMQLTHISTAYNTNPNPGTKAATHPFCWDWHVYDNFVEDINWSGLDAHGSYDTFVYGNTIYNCRRGISWGSSSGDAANYAGWNNNISDNIITALKSDGTSGSRENLAFGINVSGGSTVAHQRAVVARNIINFYGIVSNVNSGVIQAEATNAAVISNNIILNWGGNGILFNNALSTISIHGNQIQQLANGADTAARALSIQTASAGLVMMVIANSVVANGGTAARTGFSALILDAATAPILYGNDFAAATVSQIAMANSGQVRGTDFTPVVVPAAADTTPSVAGLLPGIHGILEMSPSGPITITDLDDGVLSQIVTLHNATANTVTFDRTNAVLDGGVNWTGTQHDTLTLMLVGTVWHELSRSTNS